MGKMLVNGQNTPKKNIPFDKSESGAFGGISTPNHYLTKI